MKKLHLKETNRPSVWRSGMSNVRRLTTCTAIVLAGMMASCSEDDNVKGEDEPVVPESNTVSLKLISGAEQAGRIKSVGTKAALTDYPKDRRLVFVTAVDVPNYQKDNKWSATAVAFNSEGTKAYITWHSDRQATYGAAQTWGGAVDVIDLTNEDKPTVETLAVSDSLKFNNVLVLEDKQLFLSSTSSIAAGTIGRIDLQDGDIKAAEMACIGFPGVSVNAVATHGTDLIAVSGHAMGTYGTFEPNCAPQRYYYGDKPERSNVVEAKEADFKDFGGKYVANWNGKSYVLYNKSGEDAKIQEVDGKAFDLGVTLVSDEKDAENYDPVTGQWIMTGEKHDYYGKHVLAIDKDGYAYVACGKNGLHVYDLNNNCAEVCSEKIFTTGVCVNDNYIYAATGAGLYIYQLIDNKAGAKELYRFAYEVEEYDEKGMPIKGTEVQLGTETRHSANFVAVNPVSGYIYMVYGQTGVRVYKFYNPEEGKQPEVTE